MPEKPTADVSVIAANYNNAAYLDAFLDSVVQSEHWPKELILIDDGSTDRSREVINARAGLPFLKAFLFEHNRGFTYALNAALDLASSKYVMRADPDDLFTPDRIGKQTRYLENNPGVDILGSNCMYFSDGNNKNINRSNFPLTHREIETTYRKGEHGVLHATVCGRMDVFQKYRYQQISPGEDYELFARMVRDGHRFANLKEPLYLVRVHRNSSTSRIQKEAIRRTFYFRDEIFGTKTKQIKVWAYYHYISHYRKSQLSSNFAAKLAHMIIASLMYPKKMMKRLALHSTPKRKP